MTEILLDIKQVARYLQMNKMTVYKLARDGRIPAFKVASEWRFRKDLIDEWLMNQLKRKPKVEGFGNGVLLKSGKTVLVVDDDRIIRDFFARSLSEFEVFTAASGHEALDIIKKNRPDLVLLDIQMPGIDGIETLKQIKQIDKSIVVIMLSAYGTLDTNIEAAHLGAYTSIAKPFDLGDMKSVIKNAMVNSVWHGESITTPKKSKKQG